MTSKAEDHLHVLWEHQRIRQVFERYRSDLSYDGRTAI